MPHLHPDRLLPAEPAVRRTARTILEAIEALPVVAVHGHVDPGVLVDDRAFTDPATLLVTGDHYVLRVLHAAGVPLDHLGRGEGGGDPRAVWRLLCTHWDAFRGSATRLWLEHELVELFGVDLPLRAETADATWDEVATRLAQPAYRPRALFARFGLEILSTTDPVGGDLTPHTALQAAGLNVVPTLRPDAITDPTVQGWSDAVDALDIGSWGQLVARLRDERMRSADAGALATDHGHRWPDTADIGERAASNLFDRLRKGEGGPGDARLLAAQLLTEMAVASLDDGLVMQLHPGVLRNHDRTSVARFGADSGSDFPVPVTFTEPLRALLERCGNEPGFRLVVFTVDESAWSRELAPMASWYPGLYLGAPWWFLDAPDALGRHFAAVAESAGYTKLSGFVDDTRAFCSIPARHDVARRAIAAHLAGLVAGHRLTLSDAQAVAVDYAHDRPAALYRRR